MVRKVKIRENEENGSGLQWWEVAKGKGEQE